MIVRPRQRVVTRRAARASGCATLARLLLLALAVLLAVGYLGPSAVVADRLTRPDRKAVMGTPADLGLAYEAVEFASVEDGIPLRGWWVPVDGSDRAVIVVHGRNSNRSTSANGPHLRQTRGLAEAGYSVLLFDLRAHGASGGVRYSLGPFERRDVLGATELVRAKGIPPGRIALLGHSMGAATSLLTAPDAPDVSVVVADSAYARLTDLLKKELPKASGLPGVFNPGILFMGDALYGVDLTMAAPEEVVGQIRPRPILFIHSEDDELVPVEHAHRLWRASGQPPDALWTVPGPDHNSVFDAHPDEYMSRVIGFIDRSIPPSQ